MAYTTIGDTNNSTPADPNQDERAFCVLESRAMIGLSDKLGQTIIRWNTADAGPGKVNVSINGQEELLLAGGPNGDATADWIEAGSTYEFRLYDSDRTRLLDRISVTTAIE